MRYTYILILSLLCGCFRSNHNTVNYKNSIENQKYVDTSQYCGACGDLLIYKQIDDYSILVVDVNSSIIFTDSTLSFEYPKDSCFIDIRIERHVGQIISFSYCSDVSINDSIVNDLFSGKVTVRKTKKNGQLYTSGNCIGIVNKTDSISASWVDIKIELSGG
jgi:hypothetical protein